MGAKKRLRGYSYEIKVYGSTRLSIITMIYQSYSAKVPEDLLLLKTIIRQLHR